MIKQQNTTSSGQVLLAVDRQRKVLGVLAARGSVRVVDLAERFNVSAETVRRDLDKLGAEGRLVRQHGGATALEIEASHRQREVVHPSEKVAMARAAVKMISEGETIILDASSTCWFLARQLPDMPLTVITNSLYICTALERRAQIRVLCPGGALAATSMSFVGSVTQEGLSRFHAGTLLFSCRGLDPRLGMTDLSEEQAAVRRKMMAISDRRILMADSSKWGERAWSVIGRMDEIDGLITDAEAPHADLEFLRNRGLDIHVVTPDT